MALFAGTIDFPANQKLVPLFMRIAVTGMQRAS